MLQKLLLFCLCLQHYLDVTTSSTILRHRRRRGMMISSNRDRRRNNYKNEALSLFDKRKRDNQRKLQNSSGTPSMTIYLMIMRESGSPLQPIFYQEPTKQPTLKPTQKPTKLPSQNPTQQLTKKPSQEPSQEPSIKPSQEPSLKPSQEPSLKPSQEPSLKPSQEPSLKPSQEPSFKPSQESSRNPSRNPSQEPSQKPSQRPSQNFSKKLSTQNPTQLPASNPTQRPTQNPTRRLTQTPTRQPILKPTERPTQQPTQEPTQNPTQEPTQNPTQEPTQNPTQERTTNPTQDPTEHPTQEPSTYEPTQKPTQEPTTREPTENPTQEPTERLPPPKEEDDNVLDVIIVGGGWSGISAFEFLAERGVENVELLEARNYLGGRTRTVNDFVPGVSTELGAAWVYDNTEIQDLVDKFDVNYGAFYYDNDNNNNNDWSYLGLYKSGQFQDDDDDPSPLLNVTETQYLLNIEWEKFYVPYSRASTQELRGRKMDLPYQTVLNMFIEKWSLPKTVRQFIYAMVHSQLSLQYAAPLNEVSTRAVGESVNRCIFCGSSHYTAVAGGGFDKLIEGIMSDPYIDNNDSNRVHLQSIVKKIEYDYPDNNSEEEELVIVTYEDKNGNLCSKAAKHVLVTVPLGVLKANHIEFVPSLPSWKQRAIDYIGYGTLNKCILYWEKEEEVRWWPKDKAVVNLITDTDEDSGFWTTFFNDRELGNTNGHFILTAWIGGENAKRSEETQSSDDDVLDTILQNLRSMFGSTVPQPKKYIVTRWGQDPFALGSYSFVPVTTTSINQARIDLRWPTGGQNNDKLFFSGEATDTFYGTVNGARRSGIQAARNILVRLQ